MSIAHPYPGEWKWWASFDGGECFTVGPDATREEVIVQAIADGSGDYTEDNVKWRTTFIIAQCRYNNVDLATFFDVVPWLEWVGEAMDDNMCGSDAYGENHPLEELSDQDRRDLQACVRSAIRHWQERKGLKLRSYWFAGMVDEEVIDLALPPEGSSELSLQMALAQIEEKESS